MISAYEIEIQAIQDAYDALKRLDPDGQDRVIEYLRDRIADERVKARKAREAAARQRIADSAGDGDAA